MTPAVQCLTRACAAAAVSAFDNVPINRVIARKWSDDANVQWLARAATTPITTTSAPALVHTLLPDFVAALAAQSAAARVFENSLRLSFGDAGRIAVPTIIGNPNYAAFVGEGAPIPVVQGFVEPLVILTPQKLASIIVLTAEMIASSNIEALMSDALIRSTALALDNVLFDANPADVNRPAGLRYNIAPLTASSAPDAFDALVSDVEKLNLAIGAITALPALLITGPAKTQTARLRTYGTLDYVFGSNALRGTNQIIAIAPEALAVAVGALPQISVKRGEVTVNASNPALALVANDGTVATPSISTWQADCVALKVSWPVTWALRSSSGVAWMTTVNW